MDLLVSTGGIGEHAARVRSAVRRGLDWFGVQLDETTNQSGASVISTGTSWTMVSVVHANEDLAIARHAHHPTSR